MPSKKTRIEFDKNKTIYNYYLLVFIWGRF